MSEFRALGQSSVKPNKDLETFATPIGVHRIELDYDEFTSVCPITGQPDLATIRIVIIPDTLCLESKSLKLYFHTFREVGIFAEALAAQVCDDLFRATKPLSCDVQVTQKRRGGIQIMAAARKVRL